MTQRRIMAYNPAITCRPMTHIVQYVCHTYNVIIPYTSAGLGHGLAEYLGDGKLGPSLAPSTKLGDWSRSTDLAKTTAGCAVEKRPGWDGLGVLQLRTVPARQYPIDAELGVIPKTPPARRWMGQRGNAAAWHMAIAKKQNSEATK